MANYRLWAGTYTDSIYTLDFDGKSLHIIQTWDGLVNPSYVQPVEGRVFAVEETADSGAILELISAEGISRRYPVPGAGLCHITVCGGYLYASGYNGGCLTGIDRQSGQVICFLEHHGKGSRPDRQEKAHVHSAQPTPDGRRLLVADLGLDKLFQYQIGAEGALSPYSPQPWVQTSPGQGPRHFAFHPNGEWLYLVTELDLTLRVYKYAPELSQLEFQNEHSLRGGYDCDGALAADVHVSPDGHFVYASVRGTDRIFGFRTAENAGGLEPIGDWPSGGKEPRSFHLSPDGKYLAAANQTSGTVVVFPIDGASGRLGDSVAEVAIPAASCIKWEK